MVFRDTINFWLTPKISIKLPSQTEWGIFAYRVIPFGLTNALATFQRLMSHAFKEYLSNFLEVYMDDLCVHSSIQAAHFEHRKKIFKKCRLYRICLNPEKCTFMGRQGNILGHIVSKNGIANDMYKIQVIDDLPRPPTVKGVQAFMGHCGYYTQFIYIYAIIAKPMYSLITHSEWTDECKESFMKHKQALTSTTILKAPDWSKIFHIHVDASNLSIGCILAQPRDRKIDFPFLHKTHRLLHFSYLLHYLLFRSHLVKHISRYSVDSSLQLLRPHRPTRYRLYSVIMPIQCYHMCINKGSNYLKLFPRNWPWHQWTGQNLLCMLLL
ncbi:hypothetical protein GOP47_0007846 [Adiantum capillus-veneris]|uniref:Reverse transcriptase domain-containing protein n=1 Tax=Adiantum capillus-veneris TaxID=13818 RepID=A0A9D4ZLC2_ADICA|nr:hypothetical protein GOP47_0007846 [Adiantum capillus-veneris]